MKYDRYRIVTNGRVFKAQVRGLFNIWYSPLSNWRHTGSHEYPVTCSPRYFDSIEKASEAISKWIDEQAIYRARKREAKLKNKRWYVVKYYDIIPNVPSFLV